MRIELRSSAEATCPQCGSHELLRVRRSAGATSEPLAAELGLTPRLPRWAFLRRKLVVELEQKLREEELRLLDESRLPFVEEEVNE